MMKLIRITVGGILLFLVGMGAHAKEVASKEKEPAAFEKTLRFLVSGCLVRQDKSNIPATVSGKVEYGFSPHKGGWCFYLYNPAKDGKPVVTEVNLDRERVRLLIRVVDLVSGEKIAAILQFQFKVAVGPGQYRILNIERSDFEWDSEEKYNGEEINKGKSIR